MLTSYTVCLYNKQKLTRACVITQLLKYYLKIGQNRIGGVMVSLLALITADCGFKPGQVISKTIKLVIAASPLSTQHQGVFT